MSYFLLILSVLTSTGKSVIFKKIGLNSSSVRQLAFSNCLSFCFAALITIGFTGFDFVGLKNISQFSLFMSVLFAICTVLTYLTQIRAMALGPTSSTMLIYSCGFLIPIFWSALFYKEPISTIQILSILILLLALFLIINPQKGMKFSTAWLFFSLLSMIGSGGIAVLQKVHQRSAFADEFSLLLSWAFLFATVMLSVILLLLPKAEYTSAKDGGRFRRAALSGLFVSMLNILNLRLAGRIPAVVLFPTYNVGSIILSGMICAILFKEKTEKKQRVGFAVGCLAILLIGIF